MTDSATRKWPLGRHLGFLTSPLFLATVAVAGVMFVGGHMGPTMSRLVDEFLGGVGGSRVEYHAVSDAPLREATRIAYGADEVPMYDIGASDFLLSFGNDFVDDGSVEGGRGLAQMSDRKSVV